MAGKQYEVIVRFERVDKRSGDTTSYEVGDVYDGPSVEQYLKGVDDQGPLIREKDSPTSNDPSVKEK
jgi:hypothetical protein